VLVDKTTGQTSAIPYKCGSRRHAGECRDHWRQKLWARLRDGAIGMADASHVLFVTFTLTSRWHRRVSDSSRAEAHRVASLEVGRWLEATALRCKRSGERLQYFWIREDTKRGIAHIHALLVSSVLADEVRAWAHPKNMAPAAWYELATSGGVLGRMDAQVARSKGAVTGYVTKVLGEVTKEGQTSEILRRHQRSYGASRGFLAPIRKNPNMTGHLEDERGRPLGKLGPEWDQRFATLLFFAEACSLASGRDGVMQQDAAALLPYIHRVLVVPVDIGTKHR
jgi:hypothetical protein